MVRPILRIALALACASTAAHAQLTGILKRAIEKKVESKVAPAQEAGPPLAGDPVTASQLDALLKGLAVELTARDAADAKQKAWETKQEEWRAADDAARPDESAASAARSKNESCMHTALTKLEEEHQQSVVTRMQRLGNDPKSQEWIKKYSAASQKLSAAQQSGDKAAIEKALAEFNAALGMDAKADSAEAYKTCGRPPAPTPAMVKAASLRKEMDTLQEELRALEKGRAAKGAAAAGLAADVYALQRERLLTWYIQQKYKEPISVTKDEVALFSSRLGEIRNYEKVLR